MPDPADALAERAGRTDIGDTGLLKMFGINPRSRCPVTLVRHDGAENSVIITECTQSGFRLAVQDRPNLGEDVYIRVSGQRDVPGKIRWCHGEEAGGSF